MRISKEGFMVIAGLTMAGAIGGAAFLEIQGRANRQVNDALTGPRSSEVNPTNTIVVTSSSGTIYETPTPMPKPTIVNIDGWSCAVIDPPVVPNAFRAIEVAGNPNKWEKGPYKLIVGANGKKQRETDKIVDSWSKLRVVYKGDKVCVDP